MKNALKVKFYNRPLGADDAAAVTSLLTGSTSAKSIRKGERLLAGGIPADMPIEVDASPKPLHFTGKQFAEAIEAAKVAREAKVTASLVVFKTSAADKALAEADSLLAAIKAGKPAAK